MYLIYFRVRNGRWDPCTSTRKHKSLYLNTFKLDKQKFTKSCKCSFLSTYFPIGALLHSVPNNGYTAYLSIKTVLRLEITSKANGNKLKDESFSVIDTSILGKKDVPSAPKRSRTNDILISNSDALPLSCRRLVVATIMDKSR